MDMRKVISVVALLAVVLMPVMASADDGAGIFRKNCVSCHGKNGQGTPGLAPALKGDAFVTGKLEDVIDTVTNGRTGDQKQLQGSAYSHARLGEATLGGRYQSSGGLHTRRSAEVTDPSL